VKHEGTKIRILVVDDHDLVRSGLAALLSYDEHFDVVGEASNGLEAMEKVKAVLPDVVLMDIRMPAMDGFDATAQISKEYPGVRVLAVTHLEHDEYVKRVMRLGASGVVLKSCAVDELKQSIRTVHGGGQFLSPLISKIRESRTSAVPLDAVRKVTLTPREREVLQLIASGSSNQEAADVLHISVRTVEFYRANLIEKTNARDGPSLVRYALEEKIISIDK